MISKEDQTRNAVAEEAVDWFLEREQGPLDARESAALVEWYRASPLNVEEFLGVAAIARDLRDAGPGCDETVEALVARARADDDTPVHPLLPRAFSADRDFRVSQWRFTALAVAALIVASFGLFWLGNIGYGPRHASHSSAAVLQFATRHGEQQTHRLADGSVLHLNTDTVVTVRYDATRRTVVLESGHAKFEVVHEPGRPFQVFAGPAEIMDLGTQFDVRVRNDMAVVTVVEGRVAVGLVDGFDSSHPSSRHRRPAELVELGPDQQVSVSRSEWPASAVRVDAKRITALPHPQIAFDHQPLERVAAEFNRYAPKPIEIITPELRKLEITGTFSVDDTAELLAFLRTFDDVRLDETATYIRVSKK